MSFYMPPPVRLHDLAHSPVALYQFQGNALDTSGNSLDLGWNASEAYSTTSGPLRAAAFNGFSSRLSRAATSTLQIAGDITIEMFINYAGQPGLDASVQQRSVVTMGLNGETEATNVLWSVATNGSGEGAGMELLSESGAGVNAVYRSTPGPPPFGTYHHAAYVRTSNVWTVFLNGVLVATSGTLTTPTGGTSGILKVGSNLADTDWFTGGIASLKIIASALTPAQVLAEARFTGFA